MGRGMAGMAALNVQMRRKKFRFAISHHIRPLSREMRDAAACVVLGLRWFGQNNGSTAHFFVKSLCRMT